jgi:hypothetical protein
MAAFAPGQTVVTGDPFVQVDPLPAGTYRFQLVVEDQAGNESLPFEVMVQVVPPAPTPQPATPIVTRPRIPIEEPGPILKPRVPLAEETTRIPIFKRGGLDF